MDEYIKKETAYRAIMGERPEAREPSWFAEMILDIPAVDAVEVVHGRWVEKQGGFWETATCSNCGEKYPTVGIIPHYCPNCGAKMDLKGE